MYTGGHDKGRGNITIYKYIYIQVDMEKGEVTLPIVFDWYRKDFSSSPAGLLNWVSLFSSPPLFLSLSLLSPSLSPSPFLVLFLSLSITFFLFLSHSFPLFLSLLAAPFLSLFSSSFSLLFRITLLSRVRSLSSPLSSPLSPSLSLGMYACACACACACVCVCVCACLCMCVHIRGSRVYLYIY